MKMGHTITAPRDGIVAELLYAVGDPRAGRGELLRLGPQGWSTARWPRWGLFQLPRRTAAWGL